jgi:hypothetical protein
MPERRVGGRQADIQQTEGARECRFAGYPAGDPWPALPCSDAADGAATRRNSIRWRPSPIIRSMIPQRAAGSGSPTRRVVVS